MSQYSKYDKPHKETVYVRFRRFLENSKRIIKIATKPSAKEYWLVFRICGIGIAVLGVVSYIIQLIFSVAVPLGK